MLAKRSLDFAVALALFIALAMMAVLWTTRHISHGSKADSVKSLRF